MKIAATIEDDTIGADYLASLERAGCSRGDILALHSRDAAPSSFDGLLLCGGEDVDPELYGASRKDRLGPVNRRRDEQELSLIARARRNRVPIFGICRGLQVVNVALGGTLWQDLKAQRPRDVAHDPDSDPPGAHAHQAHVVRARPGGSRSRFATVIAALDGATVNSRHHQGVKDLAPGLATLAASPDDLVEALERPQGVFLACVQWHPENLVAESRQKAVFEAFLDASRSHARASDLAFSFGSSHPGSPPSAGGNDRPQ